MTKTIKDSMKYFIITLIIVILAAFTLRSFIAEAKTDRNQERIAELLQEMKKLEETNKKNHCSDNSEQWKKLDKAVQVLQGNF